jgi:hypothetical protein
VRFLRGSFDDAGEEKEHTGDGSGAAAAAAAAAAGVGGQLQRPSMASKAIALVFLLPVW